LLSGLVKPRGGRCLTVNSACEGLKQTRPANRLPSRPRWFSEQDLTSLIYFINDAHCTPRALSVPVYTYKYLFFRMRIRPFSTRNPNYEYLHIKNIDHQPEQKKMWLVQIQYKIRTHIQINSEVCLLWTCMFFY